MTRILALALTAVAWMDSGVPLVAAPQLEADAPISLDLEEAPAREVLEGFAQVLGGELELDPSVDGQVTVRLDRVPAAEALDAVCRQLGCRWRLVRSEPGLPDGPPRLRVFGRVALDEPLDLALEEAPVVTVLESFAEILGVELDADPEVGGSLTIELDRVPVARALDAVCRRAGCRWRLQEDPPRLRVEATGGGSGGELLVRLSGEAPAASSRPPGPPALDLRVVPPGSGGAAEGSLRLSWASPTGAVHGAAGGWSGAVSWIPLGGSEGGVVVPFLRRCHGGKRGDVSRAFEPVPLPRPDPWRGSWGGAELVLGSRGNGVEPAGSGGGGETACRPAPPVRVGVRRDGGAPYRRLLRRAGDYLQVRVAPSGPGEPGAELAVILLGDSGRGPEVGLVEADGRGAVTMRRLGVSASLWRETLELRAGGALVLELEAAPPDAQR